VGLLAAVYHSIRTKELLVSKEFFIASVIAIIFSLIGLNAITYNNTNDYTYATYIVSMWVWVGGAYATCYIITRVHGYLSVRLVVNYLVGVCAMQCVLALLIDFIPSMKTFVDSFLILSVGNTEFMNRIGRLYGIGAAVDVGGTRFSVVLVMIAVMMCDDPAVKLNKRSIAIYAVLFTWIAVRSF
jgi:uncharacterized membrane protein YdcZ (DUF606 family)